MIVYQLGYIGLLFFVTIFCQAMSTNQRNSIPLAGSRQQFLTNHSKRQTEDSVNYKR